MSIGQADRVLHELHGLLQLGLVLELFALLVLYLLLLLTLGHFGARDSCGAPSAHLVQKQVVIVVVVVAAELAVRTVSSRTPIQEALVDYDLFLARGFVHFELKGPSRKLEQVVHKSVVHLQAAQRTRIGNFICHRIDVISLTKNQPIQILPNQSSNWEAFMTRFTVVP